MSARDLKIQITQGVDYLDSSIVIVIMLMENKQIILQKRFLFEPWFKFKFTLLQTHYIFTFGRWNTIQPGIVVANIDCNCYNCIVEVDFGCIEMLFGEFVDSCNGFVGGWNRLCC